MNLTGDSGELVGDRAEQIGNKGKRGFLFSP